MGRKSDSRVSKRQLSAKRNPKFKECYCYIVECADGTFYTGWTTDLERRIKEHNAGRGSRYTRLRRPVRLVYSERQPDRSAAMRREVQIKRMNRASKLSIINFKLTIDN